ncbi:MAG: hypothetical protein R8K47_02145, partial [Mariprofundaceae bacterium]
AFSPSGDRLAAGVRHGVWLLDGRTWAELARIPMAPTPIALAFSPDGRRIAAAGMDRRVWVWSAGGGPRQDARRSVYRRLLAGLPLDGDWLRAHVALLARLARAG